MLTEMLKYQDVEEKIMNLEKKLNHNDTKTEISKLVAIIKKEQNNLISLENQAKEIFDTFEKCKNEYAKVSESLEKLVSTSVDDKTEKEISELNKKITEMSNRLTTLGRSISQSSMQSTQVLKEFERVKRSIQESKQQHKVAKEKNDELTSKLEPEIAKLKSDLASIESKLDKKMFDRYKKTKQDGIFPVFVPLKDDVCGGCRMALSAAYKSKLNDQGFVECEQCGRLIYLK